MKMRTGVLSLIALLGISGLCNAGVVFFDNFDTNLGQAAIASGVIDSSSTGTFTVTGGNIDVVGPNYFGNLCATLPESGSCVDIDGVTNGQITSTLITLPVGIYTLSFDIFGSQRGAATSTTVTFGSIYSHTFNLSSSDTTNVITFNFTIAAPTTAQIVFTSNDPAGSEFGALIDNVSVTSPIPEPSSALLLLGALPLAWIIRKRRVV